MEQNKLTARMGTEPVLGLLLKMSLPMMFSMLVNALYNIVDSVFVGHISDKAFTAVTLAYPMQMVVLATGLGIAVGTNAIVSRRLGERNHTNASECAKTGLFLALVMSGVFLVAGYGLSYIYLKPFTKDDPDVFALAMQYLPMVVGLSFGLMIELIGEKVLQATGNMKIPMISQLVGAITNIILDPIFIFACHMGITGAALATVIGQILAMIFVITYIAKRNPGVDIFLRKFKLKLSNIKSIINIGVPTFVMNAVTAFTTVALNAILLSLYSDVAVNVLGSYFKLQSFVFMPVFGLSQGSFPLMSYNYGAKNKKRFRDTFLWSMLISFVIMTAGTLIFVFIPDLLMRMFNATGEWLEMGTIALPIISLCFVGAAFGITITNMFQALGHGICSLSMSMLRQVVLLIPSVWLFGKAFGINAAWWGYPFAEVVTLVVFVPIAIMMYRKDFANMQTDTISSDTTDKNNSNATSDNDNTAH